MSSKPDHAIPSLLPGRQDPLVMMWGLEGGEERCKKNQTKIILAVVRWLDQLVCQKYVLATDRETGSLEIQSDTCKCCSSLVHSKRSLVHSSKEFQDNCSFL